MEPTPLDVLLLDGECRQTLTCLRTYARAGLRVGVVTSASEAWWAPGLQSKWCAMGAEVPDFTVDADGYVDGLLDVIRTHRPALVIPAHDGSIQAVRSRRGELESLASLGMATDAALDIAISKERTLALATELGIAVPRSVRVDDLAGISAAIEEVGLPAVLKPIESWVERDGKGTRLTSTAVTSVEQAWRSLAYMLMAGGEVLVQQYLPGRREAVNLFLADDRYWARVAQASHRDWPALGGVSVLCETIPLLPDITLPSERLVRAMGLEGCSMVEYRRDAEGRPVLMEVNPRMGGSVALPIGAGANFPKLLREWKLGEPLTEITSYKIGRRLRWLAGDIWYLKCVLDSQGEPDIPPRGPTVRRFVTDFLHPRTRIDVVALTDMKPAASEMNKMVLKHAGNRVRKLRGRQGVAPPPPSTTSISINR